MQHKINGDEVRQIDGYATIYRQITTDSNLLAVVSDVAIDTIKQMVPDADLSDSFLLTADALQAVIELMYLKGIQDGAPDEPKVHHRCLRCRMDVVWQDGAFRTINCVDAGLAYCHDGEIKRSHIAQCI